MTLNRFYSAGLARWINRDPIEENGGVNLFTYVNSSPVNFYDPTGFASYRCCEDIDCCEQNERQCEAAGRDPACCHSVYVACHLKVAPPDGSARGDSQILGGPDVRKRHHLLSRQLQIRVVTNPPARNSPGGYLELHGQRPGLWLLYKQVGLQWRIALRSFSEYDMRTINDALAVFVGRNNDVSVTNSKLSEFLVATEALGLSRSERLIALATGFTKRLGWKQVCAIFENILLNESNQEQIGTFAAWLSCSDYWVLENCELAGKERGEVIEDCFAIVNRAMDLSPHNGGLALSLGLLYWNHPFRKQEKTDYLTNALNWFEKSILWAGEDEDDEVMFFGSMYAGDCYFELEQWGDAFAAYKRLDQNDLLESEGKERAAEIIRKMSECEKQLI